MLQQSSKEVKQQRKKVKVKKTLPETSHAPSKTHRVSLAKMPPSNHESRKRRPTAQAIANMENEVANKYDLTQLMQDLYKE